MYLAITFARLGLVTALKLSPVGRGYELDGWPTGNIVLKVHTLFFLFFFFFSAYYVVLLLTVYWKAHLALFRRPHLEKDKNKEQIWPRAVRLKIITIRAVILLDEKFLQVDWLRAVVFQVNLKYLHVKITNLFKAVV